MLRSVARRDETIGSGNRSFRSQQVIATVATQPVTAAALVPFTVDTHEPQSWTSMLGDSTRSPVAITVFHTPNRCEVTMPNLRQPAAGERVVVAWLDRARRLSAFSNDVVVR